MPCAYSIVLTTNLQLFHIFITDIATSDRESTKRQKFKVGMFLLHVQIIGLIIIDMMMTIVYTENYETKSLNRLNYGIYFKYVDTINVVNENFF